MSHRSGVIVNTALALLASIVRSRRPGLSATTRATAFALALALSAAGTALLCQSARGQESFREDDEPPAIAERTAKTPEQAISLARERDKRVEVISEGDERTTAYADPDGTRSARLSSSPVRTLCRCRPTVPARSRIERLKARYRRYRKHAHHDHTYRQAKYLARRIGRAFPRAKIRQHRADHRFSKMPGSRKWCKHIQVTIWFQKRKGSHRNIRIPYKCYRRKFGQ